MEGNGQFQSQCEQINISIIKIQLACVPQRRHVHIIWNGKMCMNIPVFHRGLLVCYLVTVVADD